MKIGILTHYYKSKNYGGLLQSYALANFMNRIEGVDCKQVTCVRTPVPSRSLKEKLKNRSLKEIIEILFSKVSKRIISKKTSKLKGLFNERQKHINVFAKSIPHTEGEEYTEKNMHTLNDTMDAFITGSDQVWNPNGPYMPYYLTFTDKLKISYAASMAAADLTQEQQSMLIPNIEKIDYVSVREETAKNIIEKYSDKLVKTVCDPVLLLEEKDWDKIVTSPLRSDKYAYSYLLGSRKDNRKIAQKIAKEMNVKIAGTPYILMEHNNFDKKYLDIKLNNVTAPDFIGLIRDSEVVLTDSFHAVVFSVIYEKQFYVVLRNVESEANNMNSRLTDFLSELGLSNRIIRNEQEITKELLNEKIDYTYAKSVIKNKREASFEFLLNAFKDTDIYNNFKIMISEL